MGAIRILNFDYRTEYVGPQETGTLRTSSSDGRIISVTHRLPVYSVRDRFRPFEIEFNSSTNLLRVGIDNFNIWEFDRNYNIAVYTSSNCDRQILYVYNTYRYARQPILLTKTPINVFNPNPAKICADGSMNATRICFVSDVENFNILDIDLKIKEDPLGNNSDIYGKPFFENAIADSIIFRFEHPNQLNTPDQFKLMHLQIVDKGKNNSVIYEFPIQIFRAPVIMVHGLWSDRNAFKIMEDKLFASQQWPRALMYRADYKGKNDLTFTENIDVFPIAVRRSLWEAVELFRFSANRVNVVTHSMGGLLTRLFLQSNAYDNHIIRFITLNGPHSGSQMANFLVEHPVLQRILFMTGHNPYNGAIHDLRVDSEAILTFLNGKRNLNKKTAPSHAIATLSLPNEAKDWGITIVNFITRLNRTSVPEIFDAQPSDIIVADLSQEAGLKRFIETSTVMGQWHVGSPDNSVVIDKVIDLLNKAPDDAAFVQDGFKPPILKYDQLYKWNQMANQILMIYKSSSVTISSPPNGTTVTPGELISVSVTGTAKISRLLFAAGNSSIDAYSNVSNSASAVFDYKIPVNAIGSINLIAVGFGDSGFVDIDSVAIDVSIPARLDSIKAFPNPVYVYAGGSTSISVTGTIMIASKEILVTFKELIIRV